jgi:hypothetical protein
MAITDAHPVVRIPKSEPGRQNVRETGFIASRTFKEALESLPINLSVRDHEKFGGYSDGGGSSISYPEFCGDVELFGAEEEAPKLRTPRHWEPGGWKSGMKNG